MPTLSRLLDRLNVGAQLGFGGSNGTPDEKRDEVETITSYALWTPPTDYPTSRASPKSSPASPSIPRATLTQPALRPCARLAHADIPPGCILYALTAPHPGSDARTSFLLDCLPDPLGWLAHCALFIRDRIGPHEGHVRWRHSSIGLVFEDGPGLAATCGGEIKVSMQWVGSLMAHVRDGGRSRVSATREIKGVLLHELVHTIQYDGQHVSHSTAPTWLTESIADYVRLQAHLGPPHWRKAGQGREERGWEDGYDAGARFFAWLEDWRDPGQAHSAKGISIREVRERERMMAEVTIRARMGVPVLPGRKGAAGSSRRVGKARATVQDAKVPAGDRGAGASKGAARDRNEASIDAPPVRPKAAPIVPASRELDISPASSSSGSGSGTRTPTQASTARSRQLNGKPQGDDSSVQPSYVVLNDEDDPASSAPPASALGEDISRTATPTQASIRSSSHQAQKPSDDKMQDQGSAASTHLHQPTPISTRYPIQTSNKQQPFNQHVGVYEEDDEDLDNGPEKAVGPWPGLIADINRRLRDGKYDEAWWAELTGVEAGLAGLWERYLADYRT